MPAKGTKKTNPLDRLVKTRLTTGRAEALARQATDCRMTKARYLRALIEGALDARVALPKPKRRALLDRDRLAVEINFLGLQARRLGNNVNQLARQANAGMVPLSRAEVVYAQNQLQLLVSAARATLEKVLA